MIDNLDAEIEDPEIAASTSNISSVAGLSASKSDQTSSTADSSGCHPSNQPSKLSFTQRFASSVAAHPKRHLYTTLLVCALLTIAAFVGAAVTGTTVALEGAKLEVESLNSNLSYIGKAVYSVLSENHENSRYRAWNLASGNIVGSVQYTPTKFWGNPNPNDPKAFYDDYWFPEKMAEIIARAEKWVDIMSLTPPNGKFLSEFKAAINKLAGRSTPENPIIVRMLFANYPRIRNLELFDFDYDAFIKELTEDLNSTDAINMRIWVGAWFIGDGIDLGWNHAKLIAVDGAFLHTGGHNMWHEIYLSENPVHDLSIEFEGSVAVDGHQYANQQWNFLETNYKDCSELCVMSISEFPKGVEPTFPPKFVEHEVEDTANYSRVKSSYYGTPLISVGSLGSVTPKEERPPSNDAIIAMIKSAKKIIHFVLQDLGPLTIPGTKAVYPGQTWPTKYLAAIGNAIYSRGIGVEMVLSNVDVWERGYSNGWDCDDVASEIIKSIRKEQGSMLDDDVLRAKLTANLRITYIRHNGSNSYGDGSPIYLHSKHIIVDDSVAYIGSQNLYSETTELAEWGVIIDDVEEVQKIKEEYFDKVWADSYTGASGDVNLQKVMESI
jgi:phosphatidylserine/phosphatidylglycerophosphate/cardiolipin synthase-like enzyme